MTQQKLLTKELERRLPKIRSQAKVDDPIVQARFFHPLSAWSWFPYEYDPQKRMFFGLVHGFEDEIGYFSLDELESVVVKGLKIERDAYFTPRPLSEVKDACEAGRF